MVRELLKPLMSSNLEDLKLLLENCKICSQERNLIISKEVIRVMQELLVNEGLTKMEYEILFPANTITT